MLAISARDGSLDMISSAHPPSAIYIVSFREQATSSRSVVIREEKSVKIGLRTADGYIGQRHHGALPASAASVPEG